MFLKTLLIQIIQRSFDKINLMDQTADKSIALVNYPCDYFWEFANGLTEQGFNVFWICATNYEARKLASKGVGSNFILNTVKDFKNNTKSNSLIKRELIKSEDPNFLSVNNIISMDRILSKLNQNDSLSYILHLQDILIPFLVENNIKFVTSGRDTSLSLMSLKVCRHLGIKWVTPTRLRIPRNFYGFCESFEFHPLIKPREVTEDDYQWAKAFLSEFRSGKSTKPVLKIAARGFVDVLKLSRRHAAAFYDLAKRSIHDVGNYYSRYTLSNIVKMYLSRRLNMILYKLNNPGKSEVGSSPFVIYPLHTQPESSIDVAGAFFSNQAELIKSISRSLPIGFDLVVKIHPTDVDGKSIKFYKEISNIPGVKIVDYKYDIKWLIMNAKIIFTLTGTMGYEGALLGKPVITFARTYYHNFPSVFFCKSPFDLAATISESLKYLPNDDSIINEIAKLKSCVFSGEVNRNYGESPSQLTIDDISQLKIAYSALYNILVDRE